MSIIQQIMTIPAVPQQRDPVPGLCVTPTFTCWHPNTGKNVKSLMYLIINITMTYYLKIMT